MKGDIFVNNKTNIFQSGSKENNFFVQQESFQTNDMPIEPVRRLNDYDYNILREDAYKDVSDELFKLEYKISRLEEELTGVDGQIQSARPNLLSIVSFYLLNIQQCHNRLYHVLIEFDHLRR